MTPLQAERVLSVSGEIDREVGGGGGREIAGKDKEA